MKYPQTLAIELNKAFPNKDLKNIADYACSAFVTMWCLGIEPEDSDAILTIQRAIKDKVLDSDCTVKWFEFVFWLTGRQLEKVDFIDINTLLKIKERTPVKYVFDGKSHWVGVENGLIAFNPLKSSIVVSNGKPSAKRVLHMNIKS